MRKNLLDAFTCLIALFLLPCCEQSELPGEEPAVVDEFDLDSKSADAPIDNDGSSNQVNVDDNSELADAPIDDDGSSNQVNVDDNSLIFVDIEQEASPALQLAVQACAGMYNRAYGGAVYTRKYDRDEKWIEELTLEPDKIMDTSQFLDICKKEFPRSVRYSYADQQTLLPNILTVAAVLEAIPLDDSLSSENDNVVFDAKVEFLDRNTPYLATEYVYNKYVDDTTGLAMISPGYEIKDPLDGDFSSFPWNPPLTGDINPTVVDFVFSEKLFVIYLVNGCIKLTQDHALLNKIVKDNPWQKPIGVWGYAHYWILAGGYLFESQSACSDLGNMGAIPSDNSSNLSFFSTRRGPITDPAEIPQNEPEDFTYDPNKTYVAFIVGDGDNTSFMLDARMEWTRQRALNCQKGDDSCPILTWTMSPHLPRIAPDVIKWYYTMSHKTGKDYFMLPPSGHLYATPSSLEMLSMQDKFIEATEQDARLLGTQSVVHWEWFYSWLWAETIFLPKYAKKEGPIKGIFPLNVPYLLPTLTWLPNQFFKILSRLDGGQAVLFKPRAWRGIDPSRGSILDKNFYLTPEEMANELGGYPRGTVTGIYMTSDGGLTLENAVIPMSRMLPDHVQLVSADTATKIVLQYKVPYGRGVGIPLTCSPDEEYDAGLCYEPCREGYNGVGPVCWKEKQLSYGRGVGTVPTDCGAGNELDAGLCYPKCWEGYDGVGPVCWSYMPLSYGRGVGTIPCNIFTGDCCGKEYDAGLCYPPCDDGYHGVGPVCWLNEASYGRGVGWVPNSCQNGQEYDAGLCYPKCQEGYHGIGPVCWLNDASYGRGVGVPIHTCPGGMEADAGLCYEPCREWYNGIGPVCWPV